MYSVITVYCKCRVDRQWQARELDTVVLFICDNYTDEFLLRASGGLCIFSLLFCVQTCSTPLRPSCRWHSNCLWEWCVDLKRTDGLQKAVCYGGKNTGPESRLAWPLPVSHTRDPQGRGHPGTMAKVLDRNGAFFPFYCGIMSPFKNGRTPRKEIQISHFPRKKKGRSSNSGCRSPHGISMQELHSHVWRELCFQFTTVEWPSSFMSILCVGIWAFDSSFSLVLGKLVNFR